jgi:undecaprenyl pyrophosphate phosphatase UppP
VRRFFHLNAAEWVAILVVIVGLVMWLARLEARVDAQGRDMRSVKEEQAEAIGQFRQDIQYIRMRLDEALDHRALR